MGGAQRCLDEAITYTKERKQFGQAIADFQNTQFTLADMETELQAARMLLYAAAVKVTENAPDKTKFAAMAKRLATDSGSSIVDRALQLHGGYGYLQDYPIERFWRDLRVHSILEGTNQVMRMIVGRELTRGQWRRPGQTSWARLAGTQLPLDHADRRRAAASASTAPRRSTRSTSTWCGR